MLNIRWIIDGYRYWDKTNGNSYHLTRITHVRTGKSLFFDECPDNVSSYIDENCMHHNSPIQDIGYREWRQKLNSSYFAPVSQYERKNGKCINVSTKLINRLRRS